MAMLNKQRVILIGYLDLIGGFYTEHVQWVVIYTEIVSLALRSWARQQSSYPHTEVATVMLHYSQPII